MLQKNTLPEHSLELLTRLSPGLVELGFYLAGGTALALRYGHRISVDLDFFKTDEFEVSEVLELIERCTQGFKILNQTEGSLSVIADDTKVEFFRYKSELLEPTGLLEGIPFSSIADNAVMKLSALVNRGTKKDFFDVAELLKHFTLGDLLDDYSRKFSHHDPFMVVKSLTWFEDAEQNPDPELLLGQSWDQVKADICMVVRSL